MMPSDGQLNMRDDDVKYSGKERFNPASQTFPSFHTHFPLQRGGLSQLRWAQAASASFEVMGGST